MVFIRKGGATKPLEPPYMGPYRVVSRGPKVFYLEVGDWLEAVSVDRLKPHVGVETTVPEPAVRRGRPPLSGVASAVPHWNLEARGGSVEAEGKSQRMGGEIRQRECDY